MKKTSILSILLVFFAAIIVIGLFGDKIKIYDEEIEVESVEWISTEYENDSKLYTVKKYTLEEKEEKKKQNPDFDFDAELIVKVETGVILNFKFVCLPSNATHTELDFYIDENDASKKGIKRIDLGNNETSLEFPNTNSSITLKTFTTDGLKTTYSIKINLISPSLFPGLM